MIYTPIIFLSTNSKKCAKAISDAQAQYCLLRYMQLLSWAYYDDEGLPVITEAALDLFPRKEGFFKWIPKYAHQPSAKWVKESKGNFMYLLKVVEQLVVEVELITDKPNAMGPIAEWMHTFPPKLPQLGLVSPPLIFGKYDSFLKAKDSELKTAVNLNRYYYAITKPNSVWKGKHHKRAEPQWWQKYKKWVKDNDYHI